MVGALTIGGILQGLAQYDPTVSFRSSLDYATPFRWLRGISGFLLLAGQLVRVRWRLQRAPQNPYPV